MPAALTLNRGMFLGIAVAAVYVALRLALRRDPRGIIALAVLGVIPKPDLKQRVIREGLQAYLDDVSQAWTMNAEGGYEAPAPRRGKPRVVQEELLRVLAPAA